MKSDPAESALAALDAAPLHTPEGRSLFVKALASNSGLVVAKAARIAAAAQWTDLLEDLAAAFDRLLARGAESSGKTGARPRTGGAASDKGCAAATALARALVSLDYDAPALYLRGMRHVRMEASWGTPVDSAVELRSVCAMGLANSTFPHKLRELLHLLVDREWQARAGAVRAIAVVGDESASLLLRFKMLTGDKDPEVIAECFAAILNVEGAEAVPLVAGFTRSGNTEIRDAAILALGASRRADAIACLFGEFEHTAAAAARKCILLSLSASRTEAAVEFLLGQIRGAGESTSALAADALRLHSRDDALRARIEEALRSRAASPAG